MPQSRYEKLDESIRAVLAEVGDVKTKQAVLGEHMASIDTNLAEFSRHVREQNGRVRKLEVWKGWIIGAGLVGGGILGVFGKALFDHITQH